MGLKEREDCQHWSHLNPDAVINTEPEEQQGTEEESLKESIQRSRKPAVHKERQWEKWICEDKRTQKATVNGYAFTEI